jgi:ABC-type sugar transport system permease subunit
MVIEWWIIVSILFVCGVSVKWLLSRQTYNWRRPQDLFIDLIGIPIDALQKIFGTKPLPYAFLFPNLVIFGVFTFTPMILNFYVSFTSGESISIFDRPLVGWDNYAEIFSCEEFTKPITCDAAGYNFWTAMFNTFIFILIQVPVMCLVALGTALILNREIRGRGFWRAMFFYPVMLSPVVVANIWTWILHRKGILNEKLKETNMQITELSNLSGFELVSTMSIALIVFILMERGLRSKSKGVYNIPTMLLLVISIIVFTWSGLLNHIIPDSAWNRFFVGIFLGGLLLYFVAFKHHYAPKLLITMGCLTLLMLLEIQLQDVFDLEPYRPVNWLVTKSFGWPFFWLVFVYTWAHFGFYMLIILAGLQAIPTDLYEAAEMDASTTIYTFWRITLPLLMPTFIVVLLLSLIKGFQIFDEVYLLTGGGPGNSTFMIVQFIYESAFSGETKRYGIAAAASVIMAIVISVLTLAQLFFTRRFSRD